MKLKLLIGFLLLGGLVHAEELTKREAAQFCLKGAKLAACRAAKYECSSGENMWDYYATTCMDSTENIPTNSTKENLCEEGINIALTLHKQRALWLNDNFMKSTIDRCVGKSKFYRAWCADGVCSFNSENECHENGNANCTQNLEGK